MSNSTESEDVRYLFGDELSIKNDELEILFTSFLDTDEVETSDSLIIVAIIVVVAIAASIFYLKGYKKKA